MKRIIICMDGTWQSLVQDELTNIGVIALSIAHKEKRPEGDIEQIVIYTPGVGSVVEALPERTFLGVIQKFLARVRGGAFGAGLEDSIVESYVRLCFNYEYGDEIYIFGFSRGAFAARSLAGMINNVGILSRRYVSRAWDAFSLYRARVDRRIYEIKEKNGLKTVRKPSAWTEVEESVHKATLHDFRKRFGKGRRNDQGERLQTDDVPPIKYLGIFDTVTQRGMPDLFGVVQSGLNKKFKFHDLQIGANVENARHALAIDEDRLGFPVTPWENLEEANARGKGSFEQRWFVGMHGDIGGGGEGSQLAPFPLLWIAEGAHNAGLQFYPTAESPLNKIVAQNTPIENARFVQPKLGEYISPMNWRLRRRQIWMRKDAAPDLSDIQRDFHQSVIVRAMSSVTRPIYQPASLKPFEKGLRKVAKNLIRADQLRPNTKSFLFIKWEEKDDR